MMMNAATAIATTMERASVVATSFMSRLPSACEVIPLVPMRRKPNTQ
jgi:hypothetical protein